MRALLRFATALLLTTAISAAADPALLNLVMPEARVISGFNISQVLTSPLGQFLLSQMPNETADFQKFVGLTGFDPRRDLQEVLIAAPGTPRQAQAGLILVRGSFDTARIFDLAKQHGATVRNYKGVTVLTGPRSSPNGTEEGWCAFLDSSIAALGDAASVRGAIDRRSKGSTLDSRLTARVHELSGLYDFWGVSTIPAAEWAGAVPDEKVSGAIKGDVFRAIEEASGGVRFGADIEFAGEAVTRSDKDATALADVARFLTGLVQMNAQDPKVAGFAKFLQSMELTTTGNVVRMSMRIPEAEIEKLILTAKEQGQAAGTRRGAARARRRAAAGTPVQPAPQPSAPQQAAPQERNPGDVIIHSSPKDMGTVVIKQ